MDASARFKGKKITVMGLGLLGRGLGDAKYLLSCGAELIVTDLKGEEALASSVAELRSAGEVSFVLGEHRLEDFRGRDMILKAAGVPVDSPYLAEARREGTPVRMSADLFAEIAGIPVVGVTGTRGKSTVTHMINAILKEAGRKTVLGGNVRGVSTLALLPEVEGEEIAVLELDSWQCQGFGEALMSPSLSVFTTFYPDHLNYYKGELAPYLADKAQIFLHQKPGDTLVLGRQAEGAVMPIYKDKIRSRVVVAGEEDLPREWALALPGKHNRYNAALALACARALAVEDEAARTALEAFTALPGRLELVREIGGVRVYNDTNSTTPEAALAALEALDDGKKNIVLIMGGADKGLDMEKLIAAIPLRVKRLVMLSGTGTNRILELLPGASVYDSLPAAFGEAMRAASPGDTVVFSPAFASMGMFKNEYDRGDQFVALVNETHA